MSLAPSQPLLARVLPSAARLRPMRERMTPYTSRMKFAGIVLLALVLFPVHVLHAQDASLPGAGSAAPAVTPNAGGTDEQRGRALIDEMVAALGGDAWLHRTTMQLDGRTAAFFHGAPDPGVIEYREYERFAASGQPEAIRYEFTKKHDVVQIWTAQGGTEITYKGNQPLPKDQVEEGLRRQSHTIEDVVNTWLKQPGVMVVPEGRSMVGRRAAEKVTVLSAKNDAVTIELDSETHLPLRRTFQWRNEQFKDHDEDSEDYEDYHLVQGIQTPFTITRYKNGDMVSQRFIVKVTYNGSLSHELFDPAMPLHGKKK